MAAAAASHAAELVTVREECQVEVRSGGGVVFRRGCAFRRAGCVKEGGCIQAGGQEGRVRSGGRGVHSGCRCVQWVSKHGICAHTGARFVPFT